MTVIFSLQLRQKSTPQKAKWAQRDKFFCILSAVLFCFPLVWALWNSPNLIFQIYLRLSLVFCCGLHLIPSYVLKRFVSALNNLKRFAGVIWDRTNTREILGGFLQAQNWLRQTHDMKTVRGWETIKNEYPYTCSVLCSMQLYQTMWTSDPASHIYSAGSSYTPCQPWQDWHEWCKRLKSNVQWKKFGIPLDK